jgi:hypothetical protein
VILGDSVAGIDGTRNEENAVRRSLVQFREVVQQMSFTRRGFRVSWCPPTSSAGHVRRTLSIVFLAGGVILVFLGLNAWLGPSAGGMLASAAAIAALMYSGAAWFGAPSAPSCPQRDRIFVFDRALREVCGPRRGQPVSAGFPLPERALLEAECWAALAGEGSRFTCDDGRSRSQFDVLPVRTIDGAISYGILIDLAVRHEPVSQSAAESV